MFDFAPHFIFIVHIVVQFYHSNAHPVLRSGSGLGTVYFPVGKEVTFQWSCHLLFHFFGGSTRIDSNDYSLTDSGMWKFIFGHIIHSQNAHYKQYADNE